MNKLPIRLRLIVYAARLLGIDFMQPIIWTSRGNVNESKVRKFSEWEKHPDGTIVHIVGCRDKVSGEEIKRSAYVLAVPTAEANAQTGQLNG